MTRNYFAGNIKHLRKVHRLTQKQLADLLGKTANAISNWEQGIRKPVVGDIINVCNYFHVDIMDLMETDLSIPESNDPVSLLEKYINQNHFTDTEIEELTNYAKWIVNKRSR